MKFYDRFRAELARYADGVHRLGEPVTGALDGLPEELADFYRSWDGADLFVDALRLFAAKDVVRDGARLIIGETAGGDRLVLDARGRVVKIEADTGEELVEGTSFGRWIESMAAAEGVVFDREGEFRDELFEEDGEELLPRAAVKRERKALKIDPDAPAPAWRLAAALTRDGEVDEAREVLTALVAREPGFAWAWFDLGRLARAAGDLAAAEKAFASAADADAGYEHAGYFAAQAARVAKARGDEPARASHAARALELDPDVARAQKEAARSLLEEERVDEAREAAEVAAAVAPRDLEIVDLLRRLS